MERRKLFQLFLGIGFAPQKTIDALLIDNRPLFASPEEFYKDIAEEKEFVKEKIQEFPKLVWDIKQLSKDQILDDIDMYFEMYKAGQIQFGIPWMLLWVIHVQETAVSRDPSPGRNGYIGAMQRAPFWSNREVEHAASGWEFLAALPQRYPTDWKEILWAASYIHRIAEDRKRKGLSSTDNDEQAILDVVTHNYSATNYGRQRAAKYQELKQLLK